LGIEELDSPHEEGSQMRCWCIYQADIVTAQLETYEMQPNRPTHGYDGPIKVSAGGYKLDICDEFVRVGMTYHKRPYADDTNDLETCNTYSVRIQSPRLPSLTRSVLAMAEVSMCS
jgi:hypothetical protein